MSGRTNQATNKCLGTKFMSYYLRVEGRTKPPTSALVKNFKSYYLRVEVRTKPLTSALVQNLSPPTSGWKDEPSQEQVPWYKI